MPGWCGSPEKNGPPWPRAPNRLTFTRPNSKPWRRMTATQPESTVSRRRRRPPRLGPVLLGVILVLGAALATWYVFNRRTLVFTNQLAAPIWIAVGQGPPVTLPAGETARLTVPRGSVQVVQWNLARPLSADERPMGEELRGSVVVREPRGNIHRGASARGTETDYFAPLITNSGGDLLRVTVNAGLEGSVDCECAVRPGARRVFVGYYRLYRNSTVRARDPAGRTATFRDLGPSVTTPDGTVGLRFESKDFR
jgi:hypothetical protein